MRWYLGAILFLVSCANAFAAPVKIEDAQDYRILDQFFRMMFTHSEYGYVLEGSKPVSQMNIFPIGNLIVPQSLNFQIATCAREMIRVWDRVCPEQTNFVLKVTEIQNQPSNVPIYELLFINVPILQAEIEANIDLFRYILGPAIDAEKLVECIVLSKESLNAILRGDKVLTGIVLGFGSYNSLMHSRAEELQNAQLIKDVPPFASYSNLMEQKEVPRRQGAQLRMLFLSNSESAYSEADGKISLVPGVGFSNLDEELKSILSCYDNIPMTLARENPKFVFGAYKYFNNQKLTEKLEKDQKKIKNLLLRSAFLEYILTKITGKVPILTQAFPPSKLELNGKAEEIVAHAIWRISSQLDAETESEFIEAFCRSDPSEIERGVIHAMPGALGGLRKARVNLQFAESWFATMPEVKKLKEIAPGYLYFEQVKVGDGKTVESSDRLLISYVIEDGYGNILSANHNCWVQLSTTILGFAHGVRGMREGETRMLYIHPSLAYGASTTLPPCISLVAKVSVHQVIQESKNNLPVLEAADLSWVNDTKFYQEVEEVSSSLARSLGSRWGTWLSKSSDIDFSKVCFYLKDLSSSNKSPIYLNEKISDEKYSTCNRVFWNLISPMT